MNGRSPQSNPEASLAEALGIDRGAVVALTGCGGSMQVLLRLAEELAPARRVLITTTTQLDPPDDASGPPLLVAESYEDLEVGLRDVLSTRRSALATRGLHAANLLRGIPRRWIDRLSEAGVVANVLVKADDDRGHPLKVAGADEPVIPESTSLVVPMADPSVVGRPLDETTVRRPEVFAARLSLQFKQRIEARHVAAALVGEGGCTQGVPEAARVMPLLHAPSGVDSITLQTVARQLLKSGVPRVVALWADGPKMRVDVFEPDGRG